MQEETHIFAAAVCVVVLHKLYATAVISSSFIGELAGAHSERGTVPLLCATPSCLVARGLVSMRLWCAQPS